MLVTFGNVSPRDRRSSMRRIAFAGAVTLVTLSQLGSAAGAARTHTTVARVTATCTTRPAIPNTPSTRVSDFQVRFTTPTHISRRHTATVHVFIDYRVPVVTFPVVGFAPVVLTQEGGVSSTEVVTSAAGSPAIIGDAS